MRWHPFLCAALVLVSPALARAAANGFGVNLTWNACFSDGGAANRQFACDTNAFGETLALTFVIDTPIPDAVAVQSLVQLTVSSATVPQWWLMKNAGTCRQAALGYTNINPSAVGCVEWASESDVAAIGSYVIAGSGPNTVSISTLNVLPAGSSVSLAPGIEYFSGALKISHLKTTGVGACTGCNVPVCLVCSNATLYSTGNVVNRVLTTPANTPDSRIATWQSGQVGALACSGGRCTFTCSAQPVPTGGSTWGAVKSLYR